MPRWNEGWRGHQRSTSWGQISHYLPHKPSRCEAKVRQAGGHSWAQRLKHPSGKWPAFDQACHFCHEGDPHDQTTSSSQSLWPWQRMMANIHTLSLFAIPNETAGNFILWPCQPRHMRSYPDRAAFFLSYQTMFYLISSPLPYPNLCFMRARRGQKQAETNCETDRAERARDTADRGMAAVPATIMVPPAVEWPTSHGLVYHSPFSSLASPSLPFQL